MTQATTQQDHKAARRANATALAVLMALAITALYMFMSTRTTLWDRDEPRFTRAVVEMIQSGKYLVPTFNGRLWLDKPVMFYWLMSVPVRLLGPTELACRSCSALGIGLTCLLTFFIARRLLDEKTALWSVPILASNLMILSIGTLATSDASLLPVNVAAMLVFIRALDSRSPLPWSIALGLLMGVGTLIKGPIGLMPLPPIVIALYFARRRNRDIRLRYTHVAAALIVAAAVFAAWAIPADRATDGQFTKVFIGRHVLTRAVEPMEHHGGNFLLFLPYYIPVVIIGFFPWVLYLPAALHSALKARLPGPTTRLLLLSWIVPVFIAMSLAATKLPHYIVFIWPALAIAAAAVITSTDKNSLPQTDARWLAAGIWFFAPLAIVSALAMIVAPWFLKLPHLPMPAVACGLILLTMTVLTIARHRRCDLRGAARILLVGMAVFHIPYLFGVMPAVETTKISPRIARVINDRTSPEIPVATFGYREPSLNFYVGRHIEVLANDRDVIDWAEKPGPRMLIITRPDLTEIEKTHGPLPLVTIDTTKGFNLTKGRPLEIVTLMRSPQKL